MPPLHPRQAFKLIPFVLFFFANLSTHAQADFRPGFIINNAGDTVRGFVNFKNDLTNGKKCVFKKSIDDDEHTYTPDGIKGYRIDDQKFYLSKTFKGKKIFMECLVDGVVDLYRIKTSDGGKYFVEKDSLMELKNSKQKIVRNDGDYGTKTFEVNGKQYVNTLARAFSDDPKIFVRVNSTSLDNRSLISLVKDYHHDVCNEYECVEYIKKNKGVVYIGPKIGFASAVLKLTDLEGSAKDVSMTYGIQFRYTPTSAFYRLAFVSGVEFGKNSFRGVFHGEDDQVYNINTSYTLIRIPLVLQYTLPLKVVQPVISLGYNNVILANRSCSITDMVGEFRVPADETLRPYYYGFIGGIGLSKNVTKNMQILLKGDYEYRLSAANFHAVMDFSRIGSLMISTSCLFKL